MEILAVPKTLRDSIGDDGTDALIELLNKSNIRLQEDVLTFVEEKFERRLTEEISKVNQKISDVRSEISLSNDEKQQALSLLPQLLDESGGWRNISSIKVEYWDDQPVRNSEVVEILKNIGFRDEFKLMVLERRF